MQNNSYGWKWHKTTYFRADIMNCNKPQVNWKLGHVVYIKCPKLERLLFFLPKFQREMTVKWYWYLLSNRKQEWDWLVPFTRYFWIFRFPSRGTLALVLQTNVTANFGCSDKSLVIPSLLRRYNLFSENTPVHRREPCHVISPWNYHIFPLKVGSSPWF